MGVLALSWFGGAPGWATGPAQDRAVPGPEDQIERIVAFGTSLTARNAWPDTLSARLSACFGHPVTMTRVAGVGMGSAWGLEHINQVAALMPDLVIMEFAINDADLRDGVSVPQARAQHLALVNGLRTALPGVRIVQMTMSPARGPRGVMRPFLSRHYAMVRDLAEVADTGLADLYPRWRTASKDLRHAADGLHPSDAQAESVVIPPLVKIIADAAGADCTRYSVSSFR